jgi:hypothetical protein
MYACLCVCVWPSCRVMVLTALFLFVWPCICICMCVNVSVYVLVCITCLCFSGIVLPRTMLSFDDTLITNVSHHVFGFVCMGCLFAVDDVVAATPAILWSRSCGVHAVGPFCG